MRKNITLFVIIPVLVCLNCAGGPMTRQANDNKLHFPIEGKLALISEKDGGLFLSDADGTDVVFTEFRSYSQFLDWDRSGELLYVHRSVDNEGRLIQMNINGKIQNTYILDVFGGNLSPDGTKAVFMKWKNFPHSAEQILCIFDLTTKAEHPIEELRAGLMPQWSPDGSLILFLSNFNLETNELIHQGKLVYLINPDGSSLRPLFSDNTLVSAGDPLWSPDSKQIACIHAIGDDYISIYDLEGNPVRKVQVGDPVLKLVGWSNDGKRIMYTAALHKTLGRYKRKDTICVINIDGTDRRIIEFEPEAYKKYGKKLNQFYNVAWWQPPVEK